MYPAYIHTQTTARNIDHAAIKTYQIPSLILMEHAALKSAEIIEQITNTNQSICILCGPGNNGADGFYSLNIQIYMLWFQKSKRCPKMKKFNFK